MASTSHDHSSNETDAEKEDTIKEPTEINAKYRANLDKRSLQADAVYVKTWRSLKNRNSGEDLDDTKSFVRLLSKCELRAENKDADPEKLHLQLPFEINDKVFRESYEPHADGDMKLVTKDNLQSMLTAVFEDDNMRRLYCSYFEEEAVMLDLTTTWMDFETYKAKLKKDSCKLIETYKAKLNSMGRTRKRTLVNCSLEEGDTRDDDDSSIEVDGIKLHSSSASGDPSKKRYKDMTKEEKLEYSREAGRRHHEKKKKILLQSGRNNSEQGESAGASSGSTSTSTLDEALDTIPTAAQARPRRAPKGPKRFAAGAAPPPSVAHAVARAFSIKSNQEKVNHKNHRKGKISSPSSNHSKVNEVGEGGVGLGGTGLSGGDGGDELGGGGRGDAPAADGPALKEKRLLLPAPAAVQYGLLQKINRIKQALQLEASVGTRDAIKQANELMGNNEVTGATLPAQVDALLNQLGVDDASLQVLPDAE